MTNHLADRSWRERTASGHMAGDRPLPRNQAELLPDLSRGSLRFPNRWSLTTLTNQPCQALDPAIPQHSMRDRGTPRPGRPLIGRPERQAPAWPASSGADTKYFNKNKPEQKYPPTTRDAITNSYPLNTITPPSTRRFITELSRLLSLDTLITRLEN